jgi:hypothetical protein
LSHWALVPFGTRLRQKLAQSKLLSEVATSSLNLRVGQRLSRLWTAFFQFILLAEAPGSYANWGGILPEHRFLLLGQRLERVLDVDRAEVRPPQDSRLPGADLEVLETGAVVLA